MATHKDSCIDNERVGERVDQVTQGAAYIAGGIAVVAFPEVVAGVLVGIGLYKLTTAMVDALMD